MTTTTINPVSWNGARRYPGYCCQTTSKVFDKDYLFSNHPEPASLIYNHKSSPSMNQEPFTMINPSTSHATKSSSSLTTFAACCCDCWLLLALLQPTDPQSSPTNNQQPFSLAIIYNIYIYIYKLWSSAIMYKLWSSTIIYQQSPYIPTINHDLSPSKHPWASPRLAHGHHNGLVQEPKPCAGEEHLAPFSIDLNNWNGLKL